MKYVIFSVAILTVCLSISLATAQNKVVVVPLGGKKAVGDATQVDVVEGKTFSNSSTIGLTGTRSPGVLSATGQTLCYDATQTAIPCDSTGQDGELQMGVTATPRFADNEDGTVTDRLTGLIWLREGNCPTFFSGDPGPNNRPWLAALEAANQLSSGWCGLTDGSVAGDWRLPNIRELLSLISYGNAGPALPAGHPFVNTEWYYWSSTPYPGSVLSWRVFFLTGQSDRQSRLDSYSVRTVRGGR